MESQAHYKEDILKISEQMEVKISRNKPWKVTVEHFRTDLIATSGRVSLALPDKSTVHFRAQCLKHFWAQCVTTTEERFLAVSTCCSPLSLLFDWVPLLGDSRNCPEVDNSVVLAPNFPLSATASTLPRLATVSSSPKPIKGAPGAAFSTKHFLPLAQNSAQTSPPTSLHHSSKKNNFHSSIVS